MRFSGKHAATLEYVIVYRFKECHQVSWDCQQVIVTKEEADCHGCNRVKPTWTSKQCPFENITISSSHNTKVIFVNMTGTRKGALKVVGISELKWLD